VLRSWEENTREGMRKWLSGCNCAVTCWTDWQERRPRTIKLRPLGNLGRRSGRYNYMVYPTKCVPSPIAQKSSFRVQEQARRSVKCRPRPGSTRGLREMPLSDRNRPRAQFFLRKAFSGSPHSPFASAMNLRKMRVRQSTCAPHSLLSPRIAKVRTVI
jgi:hypothetical protein